FRFIQQAIEYEARRQVEILEDGGKIDQETRLFDTVKGETRSMRSKEEAHDYRYFPDPDLLPLALDPAWIKQIEATLPELPDAKDVFERMWAGEGSAAEIVEKQGLKQVSDTGALEGIIDALIAANPGQAAAVKDKPQAIGWFVGQVMKQTGGKANPGTVNQLL